MKATINKQRHQEVLELIPWLVNDTLTGKERLKVLNHLNECEVCQAERDRLQELATLVRADGEDSAADYKPSFDKLMQQIDSIEAEKQRFTGNQGGADVALSNSVAAPEKKGVSNVIPGRIAMGMAASVLVAFAGFTLLQEPPAQIETLNVPAANPAAELPGGGPVTQRLAITFEEGIDTTTLRATFINTGAYIVSGPDAEGRYVVELVRQESSQSDFVQSVAEMDGVKDVALIDKQPDEARN